MFTTFILNWFVYSELAHHYLYPGTLYQLFWTHYGFAVLRQIICKTYFTSHKIMDTCLLFASQSPKILMFWWRSSHSRGRNHWWRHRRMGWCWGDCRIKCIAKEMEGVGGVTLMHAYSVMMTICGESEGGFNVIYYR